MQAYDITTPEGTEAQLREFRILWSNPNRLFGDIAQYTWILETMVSLSPKEYEPMVETHLRTHNDVLWKLHLGMR